MRVLALSLAILAAPALAEPIRGAAAPPAPAVAEPQRTTATFEDWTLRCVRPEHSPAACEVTQTVSNQSQQPVAQAAIGRPPGAGETMRLTILVPPNVLIATAPRLLAAANAPVELGWRRCLPSGCIADVPMADDQIKRLRELKENGRILYQDASGRETPIPFSPKGLPAALDALAKEPG